MSKQPKDFSRFTIGVIMAVLIGFVIFGVVVEIARGITWIKWAFQ